MGYSSGPGQIAYTSWFGYLSGPLMYLEIVLKNMTSYRNNLILDKYVHFTSLDCDIYAASAPQESFATTSTNIAFLLIWSITLKDKAKYMELYYFFFEQCETCKYFKL